MRFDLPDGLRLCHEMRIPMRWGDMDAMGHLNNTLYFRFMEVLRIDWFQQLGCPPVPGGHGPVIVNAFCTFIRQLEFPGDVLARQYLGTVGRSSVETYTTLERVDQPGLHHATGGSKVVWTDAATQKSLPWPPALRQRLEAQG
jgi:acyl-CoA thioester hydrolase